MNYYMSSWPASSVFINLVDVLSGIPVRAVNRPGSQLLGANGRDDGAIVSVILLFLVDLLKF